MNPEKRQLTRAVEIVDTSTCRGMDVDGSEFRNEQNYPCVLGFSGNEEMYRWLEGKNVLDIGSGHGFFAIDVMKEKGKDFSNIISLNPRLKIKNYRDILERERGLHYTVAGRYGSQKKITKEQLDELLKEIKKRTVASEWGVKYIENNLNSKIDEKIIWSDLPFADESFDCIVSSFAFPYYARGRKLNDVDIDKFKTFVYGDKLDEESKEEILNVLKNIARVLKPGGECRLGPVNFPHPPQIFFNELVKDGKARQFGLEAKFVDDGSVCILKKLVKKQE